MQANARMLKPYEQLQEGDYYLKSDGTVTLAQSRGTAGMDTYWRPTAPVQGPCKDPLWEAAKNSHVQVAPMDNILRTRDRLKKRYGVLLGSWHTIAEASACLAKPQSIAMVPLGWPYQTSIWVELTSLSFKTQLETALALGLGLIALERIDSA